VVQAAASYLGDWTDFLEEPLDKAIHGLREAGLLHLVTEPAVLLRCWCSHRELQALCRARRLKSGGNSETLILRILVADPAILSNIQQGDAVYEVAEKGRECLRMVWLVKGSVCIQRALSRMNRPPAGMDDPRAVDEELDHLTKELQCFIDSAVVDSQFTRHCGPNTMGSSSWCGGSDDFDTRWVKSNQIGTLSESEHLVTFVTFAYTGGEAVATQTGQEHSIPLKIVLPSRGIGGREATLPALRLPEVSDEPAGRSEGPQVSQIG